MNSYCVGRALAIALHSRRESDYRTALAIQVESDTTLYIRDRLEAMVSLCTYPIRVYICPDLPAQHMGRSVSRKLYCSPDAVDLLCDVVKKWTLATKLEWN